MSLLAWLMDVYELQLGFEEQQANGSIPADEPFDPLSFTSLDPESGELFPYWFSAKPRIRLRQLYESGTISEPVASNFIGRDANGVMRGMEYIRLTNSAGLYVRTAMRPQNFPLCLSDLLDEILSVQLADRVFGWLCGEVKAVPLARVYSLVETMRQKLTIGSSAGVLTRSRVVGRQPIP